MSDDDDLFPQPYAEDSRERDSRERSSWTGDELTDAFRRVTGDEPVKSFDWLVKGMIERGKAGILFGQNQSYKSFFILSLAAHLMSGERFAGRRTRARGQAVVYVPFEGESSVNTRFREARRVLGIGSDDVRLEVMRAKPFNTDEGYRFFEDALRHYVKSYNDISLVVIDTVNQAKFFDGTPGNSENDPAAWGRVYGFLKRLSADLDLTTMLVHHAGKDLGSGGRGSSANTDDADFALTISSEKDQVTGKSVNHWLHQSKIKDGGASGPICAIIPHEVELGADEDGDRITTLTLEFDEEAQYAPPSDGWKAKPKGDGNDAKSSVADRWTAALEYALEGADVGEIVGLKLLRERTYIKATEQHRETTDKKKTNFERAIRRLIEVGRIEKVRNDGAVSVKVLS